MLRGHRSGPTPHWSGMLAGAENAYEPVAHAAVRALFLTALTDQSIYPHVGILAGEGGQ